MKKKSLLVMTLLLIVSLFSFLGCSKTNDASKEKVLGVIGAMEEEVAILKGKMKIEDTLKEAGMEFYKGNLDGKEIVLVRSGVGKVNMAACTQILVDKFNVSAVIN